MKKEFQIKIVKKLLMNKSLWRQNKVQPIVTLII